MSSTKSSGTLEVVSQALIDCIGRIHARGWCEGTSGNYSVVLERDPTRLLITRSGMDKGRIAPTEDLVIVGADGKPVGGEAHRPSAESLLHAAVVGETGAGSVLHSHSVWGTLLGERFLEEGALRISGYEMIKGIAGMTSHETELLVPVLANSQDMDALSERVCRVLHMQPAVRGFLIAGHGLYAWGEDLDEAYRHVEIFEFLFQVVGRRESLPPFRQ